MPKIYAPAAALFWLSTAKKQMLDENEFVCIGVALIGHLHTALIHKSHNVNLSGSSG